MKTLALAPLTVGLVLAFSANAQDHSHRQMATQDHSQHQQAVDHSQHQQTEPAPKTGTTVDHAAMGHAMPAAPTGTVDHAAIGHGPDQPKTPIPVLTDADRAAAIPPPDDHPVHDNAIHSFVLFNRLEAFDSDEESGQAWEGQAWIGTDQNKLWLRSEGERVDSHTGAADVEVLYGRPIARWWDLVAGVRHDFQPGGSQDFAAIGVIGLAPYKFEVEATAYVGESGQTAGRIEVEYETLLTNRLILQPLVELNFYGKNDERRGIGSGLGKAEAGLRLRYEITRQFAPYVGVVREWTFGNTADFRRSESEDINDARIVAGFRIWF
jgi:copper resistance protein B